MGRGKLTRTRAVLAAMSLLLCIADPGFGEAGSLPGRRFGPDSGGGKSVRLSLKISGAKKRNLLVSFYKSVARQAKIHPTGDRSLPWGR